MCPLGCCAPPAGGGPCGAGLDPGDHCGPSGRKHGQAPACPALGAARPVSPCPAHKRTPGTEDELAFDTQKKNRNDKNPLTGSVHAFRGLPGGVAVVVVGGRLLVIAGEDCRSPLVEPGVPVHGASLGGDGGVAGTERVLEPEDAVFCRMHISSRPRVCARA